MTRRSSAPVDTSKAASTRLIRSIAGVAGARPDCRWLRRRSPVESASDGTIHMHLAATDDALFGAVVDQTFGVTLRDTSVSPTTLRAARNSLIEVDLGDTGLLGHDFTIDKIDVDYAIQRSGEMPTAHVHADQYPVHVGVGPEAVGRVVAAPPPAWNISVPLRSAWAP